MCVCVCVRVQFKRRRKKIKRWNLATTRKNVKRKYLISLEFILFFPYIYPYSSIKGWWSFLEDIEQKKRRHHHINWLKCLKKNIIICAPIWKNENLLFFFVQEFSHKPIRRKTKEGNYSYLWKWESIYEKWKRFYLLIYFSLLSDKK